MSKYNFEKNIQILSKSKNIKIIPNEWVYINTSIDTGRCICNRSIKHINYFFNNETGNTIMVGNACKKKLQLNKTRNSIHKFVDKLLYDKGIYYQILDFIKYSNDTMNKIIDDIDERISYKQTSKDLELLKINLLTLNSKLKKPDDIYQKIKNLCDNIDKIVDNKKHNYIIIKLTSLINSIKNIKQLDTINNNIPYLVDAKYKLVYSTNPIRLSFNKSNKIYNKKNLLNLNKKLIIECITEKIQIEIEEELELKKYRDQVKLDYIQQCKQEEIELIKYHEQCEYNCINDLRYEKIMTYDNEDLRFFKEQLFSHCDDKYNIREIYFNKSTFELSFINTDKVDKQILNKYNNDIINMFFTEIINHRESYCTCKHKFMHICVCSSPVVNILKTSNDKWCNTCNKWICPC